jgi:hypothetical protein
MDEQTEVVVVKPTLDEQIVVTVVSGLAGIVTHKLVTQGYRFAKAAYLARKAAA